MTPDSIFKLANTTALLSWILLAVLGRRPWVSRLTTAVIVPGILGITYAVVIVAHIGGSKGSFNTLSGVAELFSDPWLLLAGWVHYLAFDLFIGSWEVRDAISNRISHWLVIPCLFLTFMFGPVGFVCYLLLRWFTRRQLAIG